MFSYKEIKVASSCDCWGDKNMMRHMKFIIMMNIYVRYQIIQKY